MILFIRSSTNPGPRVNRIINFLSKKTKQVKYLSPYRSGDEVSNDVNRPGNLGTYDYFDGNGYFSYLKFLFFTNFKIAFFILKYRKKIELVHFSDLEVVLFGGLLCKVFGIEYVYNIHDNFFQRYDYNKLVSGTLKWLECAYIGMSSMTLIPESFRGDAYPNCVAEKFQVFRNFPDFDVTTERQPFEGNSVNLFYGGWVSSNRSLELFLKLASFLTSSQKKVKMTICGWGDEKYIEYLRSNFESINVEFEYLGQLRQLDAIDHLRASDVSIAYYNPDKEINVFAASNKIPEILGSSTILITNSHTEIAKELSQNDLCLQFDNNIEEVYEDLMMLISDREKCTSLIGRSKVYYKSKYNPNLISEKLEELFCEYV